MNRAPTYEEFLFVMAKVAGGDATARVPVPESPDPDDALSLLAIALNLLLDDVEYQHRELQRSYDEIQAQQAAIRRLWTPMLTVADRVLLLPILGLIDVARSKQMMETVLNRVHAVRAQVVIIDLTAVPEIDAQAAAGLSGLASTVELLGAEVIIAGISASLAQAMTGAGIDLRKIRTEANLAHAIRTATAIASGAQGNPS